MAFRELTVVVIEAGRTLVRAGLGLHDLLKTPAVEIQARVGLRADASSSPSVSEYLVGPALDEAISNGTPLQLFHPFASGDITEFTQTEAILKYVLFAGLHLRRVQNESPVLICLPPGLSRAVHTRLCQMFFERFNVAGYTTIDRPLAQLYAANTLSGVVVDIGWETTDITPIYDGFIVHSARASNPIGVKHCTAYLANLLSMNQSVQSLLSTDPPPDLHALAQQIWLSDLVKVPSDGETALVPDDDGITDIASILVAGREKAVIESGMKKRASAKASAAEQARAREIEALDLVTVNFGTGEDAVALTIGKERHRLCEPLFDPGLLAGLPGIEWSRDGGDQPLSLQDAVGYAVKETEVEQRQYVWSSLFVTGELSNHVKGLSTALQSRLAPYILLNPDLHQHNEVQTRSIRTIAVPEYFAEYRDRGDGLAAFLGSCIVAKITLSDPQGKNYVSKTDYTNKGPHAIIEMSPSLL